MQSDASIRIRSKINEACAKHSSRYAINAVRVLPKDENNSYLVATDGRILAVNETESSGFNEPCYLPGVMAKTTTKKPRMLTKRGTEWRDEQKRTFCPEPDAGAFPQFQDVLPKLGDDYASISVNADLLTSLMQALHDCGSDYPQRVTLFIHADSKDKPSTKPAVVVGPSGIGVIMPISDNTTPKKRYDDMRSDLAKKKA